MPPWCVSGSKIYLDNIPVFRDAKRIWIHWIIEERFGDFMLHHFLEHLLQGTSLE